MLLLALGLAGAAGAPARYLVDGLVQERTSGAFPLGTFLINVTGAFLLGLLTGLALYHAFPSTPKTVLGSGFLGAYTTFSTFTYETVRLAEDGRHRAALANFVVSLVIPALAAGAGLALASL